MMALGWKGGIGTASRRLPEKQGGWTVGVLVLANYGGFLTVDGVPVNRAWGLSSGLETRTPPGGSAIVVIATDAPLLPRELRRLAQRAFLGLARTGSFMQHGSGDYAIAFSTHPAVRRRAGTERTLTSVPFVLHEALNPLFLAVVEATEEAVYNALLKAETMTGYRGRRGEALPIDRLVELGRSMGRPWRRPAERR
jgi:D-aminopeptidase